MRRELRGHYPAEDSKGRKYGVLVYAVIKEGLAIGDQGGEVEVGTEYLTASRLPLDHIDKGEYQIRATGIILKSTDPAAP
jgi:hypothetical protein